MNHNAMPNKLCFCHFVYRLAVPVQTPVRELASVLAKLPRNSVLQYASVGLRGNHVKIRFLISYHSNHH